MRNEPRSILIRWIPGYLISAIYFSCFDSSLLKGQTIGKKVFSITVVNTEGKLISPFAAFVRYILITIPLLNSLISQSIATTVGITNTTIGGSIFLTIVGILLIGNTFFMLFHPQKRGLHDILSKSLVVRANYEHGEQIKTFSLKPLISSFVGLALLVAFFGNLYFKVGKNPDFSDISDLSDRIQKASAMTNGSVQYSVSPFLIPSLPPQPAEVKVSSENGPPNSHVGGIDFLLERVFGTIASSYK